MNLSELLELSDFERAARAVTDDATWAYLAGGAGTERGVAANTAAFDDLWLQPRVLAGGGNPDTTVTLFGQTLDTPVLLGPTSPARIVHPDAEPAVARAAAAAGTVSIVSADGHHPFGEVAAAAEKRCWFQLYPYRSHADVVRTVAVAEDGGATGLVLTVDAFHRPRRLSTLRTRFALPDGVDFGTLRAAGVLDGGSGDGVPSDARLDRLPLTWPDLERLRAATALPLLVKGVLRPDDAERCLQAGVDGLIVSNHGGRQLDSVVPSLVALERVAARVAGRCPVLVDGGVRGGGDVVKALALGADAVCVARPYLWGLRLAGQAGVEAVLDLFDREIRDAMRQLGVAALTDIDHDCVLRNQGGPR